MPLSKQFIEKQRKALLAEKERLESQIKDLKKYPNYGDMDDDNSQELVDYENRMSAEDSLENIYKKVKLALKSIDDGAYGVCKKCQGFIEKDRLEIMPFAQICVSCKKKTT